MKKTILLCLLIILTGTLHRTLPAAAASQADAMHEIKEILKEPTTEEEFKSWFKSVMGNNQTTQTIEEKGNFTTQVAFMMMKYNQYDYILEIINNTPHIEHLKLQLIFTAIYSHIKHAEKAYKPISYPNGKKIQVLIKRISELVQDHFLALDYFTTVIKKDHALKSTLGDFALFGVLVSLNGWMNIKDLNDFVQTGLEQFLFGDHTSETILPLLQELLDAELFLPSLLVHAYKRFCETKNQPLKQEIIALLNDAQIHENESIASPLAHQELKEINNAPAEDEEKTLKLYVEQKLTKTHKGLHTNEEKLEMSNNICTLLEKYHAYDYFLNMAQTTSVVNDALAQKIGCILKGIYFHVTHTYTTQENYKAISYANCSRMIFTIIHSFLNYSASKPLIVKLFSSYIETGQPLRRVHADLAFLAILSRTEGCLEQKPVWQFFLNGLSAFVFSKQNDEVLLTHVQELVQANIFDPYWFLKAYKADCRTKNQATNKEVVDILNTAIQKYRNMTHEPHEIEDRSLGNDQNLPAETKMQKRLKEKLLARQALKAKAPEIPLNQEASNQTQAELDATLAAQNRKEKAKLKKKRQAETKKTQALQLQQELAMRETQAQKQVEERARAARDNEIAQEQAEAARNSALQQQAHEKLASQIHNASQNNFQNRVANRQYKKAEKRSAHAHKAAQRTQQQAAHIEKNQAESPAHADAPPQTTTAHNEVKTLEAELEKLSLDDGNDDQAESKQLQVESVWKGSVQETNFNVLKQKLFTASSTGDVAFLSYLIFKPEFGEYKPITYGDYHIYQYSKNDLQRVLNTPLDDHGNRALHIAIMHGQLAFALQLINSFKIINKFVKNDQGDRPAHLLLRYIKNNQKVFPKINIHINLEECFPKELLQDEMTNWYASNSPQRNEIITTTKELINIFSKPMITLNPKRKEDGEIKAYTIFELLEKFMIMDE